MFVPKLFTALKTYDREQFSGDLVAGIIVGVVALPLAIAFAIASGVSPDRGLWTAIVAGFLVSVLGGSRVQIGGPTGAFVVIVYGIVQKYGVDGLTVATLMAGVILILMGIVKLGAMIKFIPHPVITGFTSGIAVIIFSGEVKDFLGLRMGAVPADFIGKWSAYSHNATDFTPDAVLVGFVALAIVLLWPKLNRRIPGPFVALIATTALAQVMHLPIETIGSRFGALSASMPHPQIPHLSLLQVTALVGPAFTIAILAAIESLLSAVVADGMIGGRHRSNMELIAQGIANTASALFGGIPATGAIARTATNVKNGGRTPVAGVIHSLTLLLITLFFGRWAALIPMATLAAILVVVSYHMSEWRTFRAELRSPKSDVAALITTFSLTVLIDLTVAIGVGMVLAAFLFIRRMAEVTNVTAISRELRDEESSEEGEDFYALDPNGMRRRQIPPGVEVYEINGPFFFGAAETFKDTISQIAGTPKVLIIRMRGVLALDSTGMHALKDVVHRSRQDGTAVLLADVHMQPLVALTGSPVLAEIGEENLFGNLDDALNRARSLVGLQPIAPPAGVFPTVSRETPPTGIPKLISPLRLQAISPATAAEFTRIVSFLTAELHADLGKILMLEPDGESLLLVTGIGWHEGLVGTARVHMDGSGQAAYALRHHSPVIFENLPHTSRFGEAKLLLEHHVISSVAVAIRQGDEAVGVLSVHTCVPRTFTSDELGLVAKAAESVARALRMGSAAEN